jgi:hypothetical protein
MALHWSIKIGQVLWLGRLVQDLVTDSAGEQEQGHGQ